MRKEKTTYRLNARNNDNKIGFQQYGKSSYKSIRKQPKKTIEKLMKSNRTLLVKGKNKKRRKENKGKDKAQRCKCFHLLVGKDKKI